MFSCSSRRISAAVTTLVVPGIALEAAIGDLPVAHRAIILLHDVEGMPMADIAVSLGITLASAKTRAHRARLLLRKRLANFMSKAAVV